MGFIVHRAVRAIVVNVGKRMHPPYSRNLRKMRYLSSTSVLSSSDRVRKHNLKFSHTKPNLATLTIGVALFVKMFLGYGGSLDRGTTQPMHRRSAIMI